jgi:two-component system response regulator (stage 0 sporulation protein A)
MDERKRVLIVDDNEDLLKAAMDFFRNDRLVDVVDVARNGKEGLQKINELQPELVVLDLVMPGMDGIFVLEILSKSSDTKKPMIIITSALGKDATVIKAMELGADYYIMKPFDYPTLRRRILQNLNVEDMDHLVNEKEDVVYFHHQKELTEQEIRNLLECEVTNLLRDSNIPAHMLGYRYLREAVIALVKLENKRESFKESVYPVVAEMFGTSVGKVERSIRNAIDKAWLHNSEDEVDLLLGYSDGDVKNKPTNTQFISLMTEKVILSMKKNGIYFNM